MPTVSAPRFSIVMPAHNAADTVGETLESVIAQTLGDWELILVDDGSTDETGAVAQSYSDRDPRIRVVRQSNAGCGPARGTAVEHACGRLIARLDADDLYLPTYLEEMSAFIEQHPDYDIYSCNGEVFFPDGHAEPFHSDRRYRRVMSLSLEDMMEENRIFSPAVFRREIFDVAGGFPAGVWVEDYDFWLRAMAKGARHIYLPRVLVRYRVSDAQMSADPLRLWEGSLQSLQDLLDSGVLDSPRCRKARSAIRRLWRLRAVMALRGQWESPSGRSRRTYLLEKGDYSTRTGCMFIGLMILMAGPTLVEWALRGFVAGTIYLLRAVFPFLKNVRVRSRSERY